MYVDHPPFGGELFGYPVAIETSREQLLGSCRIVFRSATNERSGCGSVRNR